ncbi:MAG TPA: hypothetical protein VFV73_41060 [Streptosporangiaceae bacterium]|nr:hypothetical protein [Streptosporangiaceae bacterium]
MTYAQAGRPRARKPGAPGDSFATWLRRLRWPVVAGIPTVVMLHGLSSSLSKVADREQSRLWAGIGTRIARHPAGLASLRIDNNPVNNVKGNPGSVVGQHLLAANFPAGARDAGRGRRGAQRIGHRARQLESSSPALDRERTPA